MVRGIQEGWTNGTGDSGGPDEWYGGPRRAGRLVQRTQGGQTKGMENSGRQTKGTENSGEQTKGTENSGEQTKDTEKK